MTIVIHTDKHIQGNEDVSERVRGLVEQSLSHCIDKVQSAAVYLSAEKSKNVGIEAKRCLIEVHVKAMKPVAISCTAETLAAAIDGATSKIKSTLDRRMGRRFGMNKKRHESIIPHLSIPAPSDNEF